MSTIPASQIVSVIPGVLGAGGSALDLNGLILTANTRVPIDSILSFASAADVATYFGSGSAEAITASTYFLGFDDSNVKPGAILFAQYPATSVPAYLRGGNVSTLTLAQLQALSGTIIVMGKTSATINLSTASSFSNAATLIQAGFTGANLYDGITSSASTIAAGTATNSTAASITGNVLTVAGTITGSFVVGGVLTGTGVTAGTTILAQLTGSAGGAGTYLVSAVQTVATTTITQTYGVLTVGAMTSGFLAPGQIISGGTTAAGTTIVSQLTGTPGGAGTYITSGGSQTVSASIISAGPLAVAYDSVAGAFTFTAGTPITDVMTYATGTLSTSLLLTAVTGAILSQGKAAATPSAFMGAVINQTQNWATFMTIFDPDAYGNSNQQLFAAWANAQGNRYAYVCWDNDISPTLSNAATSSLGYILTQAGTSGTIVIYAPDYTKAAFVCGMIASIDFNETNGRITLAFKSQSGMTADVTTATIATNLIANGYNYYGSYSTANQGYNFFYPGSVTGEFKWADSYVNEIWLNNAFQLALMDLLTTVKAIPYDNVGYTLIRAALQDPINQGLNFGAFAGGVALSSAQIAEINTAAGAPVAANLAANGYYLQILPATAQIRAARSSPECTFWYTDAGSVQKISLASIEVQ
jgi:hypothetical protein